MNISSPVNDLSPCGFVGDNAFRLVINCSWTNMQRSRICLVKTIVHDWARSEWMISYTVKTVAIQCIDHLVHKTPSQGCHHSSACQEYGCYSSTWSYWVFMKSCLCHGKRSHTFPGEHNIMPEIKYNLCHINRKTLSQNIPADGNLILQSVPWAPS